MAESQRDLQEEVKALKEKVAGLERELQTSYSRNRPPGPYDDDSIPFGSNNEAGAYRGDPSDYC
jgi:hypothetical protein